MLISNGSTALDKPNCFVAYPSMPEDRAESIEKAIEEFNTGGVVDVLGWKSLTVAGRVVVTAICDEIKTRHVFIADVTGLNPNVMFELGYAIGRKKRIWLLLNRDIEHAKKEFDRFQLLTTIGYQTYSNSSDITGKFYRDEPYKKVGQRLYD
jgi:nucleoside 2-deoxyribosyltransferase